VEQAQQAFSGIRYAPFAGVVWGLDMLRNGVDADLYVVSEGDLACQRRKIGVLGLDGFFDESRILITDEVAPASKLLDEIRKRVDVDVDVDENALRVLASRLGEVREQKRRLFHSRAIAAIFEHPSAPYPAINKINEGRKYEATEPVQIAVIGDRPETDEAPYRGLERSLEWTGDGKEALMIMRLTQGPYKSLPSSEGVRPACNAASFPGAVSVLLGPSSWERRAAIAAVTFPRRSGVRLSVKDKDLLKPLFNHNNLVTLLNEVFYPGMEGDERIGEMPGNG